MIIRSITVSGWRCFADPLSLGSLDDRLNIIYAPNGTGKSTIFDALRRAFLDGHNSSGRDVEALRPWGRELSPRVAVEFVSEGKEYRISKSFLYGKQSVLERKEREIFQKLAEGKLADSRVRELLLKDPPSKNFTKPESWGLAQVLWAPQGSLELGTLSGSLVQDIRSVLTQQVMGAGAYDRKIQERHDKYFTQKRGDLKTGSNAPEIVKIQSDLKNYRNQLEEWRERYEELYEIAESVGDLRSTSARLSTEVASQEKILVDQEKMAREYEKLLAERNSRQLQAERLEAQHQSVSQKMSAIIETEKEMKSTNDILEKIQTELPAKEEQCQKARSSSTELWKLLQVARNRKKELDVQRNRTKLATELQQAMNRRVHVEKSLTIAVQLERSLKELNAERTTIIAPDHDTLGAIRKCIKERDEARVKIDASLISLEITPENAGTLDVVSGENVGIVALEPKNPTVVKGSPEVVAVLPGVVRLRASGPTVSIAKTRKILEIALAGLAELTRPYGTTDMDELEALQERADALDGRIRDARIQLGTMLGDSTLADLHAQRDSFVTTISAILAQNPDWAKSCPDPAVLENELRSLESQIESSITNLETEVDKAKDLRLLAEAEVSKLQFTFSNNSAKLSELERKLREMSADDKTLNDRNQERSNIAIEWDAAKGKLKEAKKSLEKLGEDPGGCVEKLKATLADLTSQAQGARDQAATQNGILSSGLALAPYSRLTEIEEKIGSLAIREREESIRIDAIKLLKDVVDQSRSAALEEVTIPVENRASAIFKTISDDRLGKVTLDTNFQPVGVSPGITDEKIGLYNLSGGELEQIHLATRLALAETLRKDDRQVLILDDILTATDSIRIGKIMDVFEEAAEYLQLIILTCHPERYLTLKAAKTFDLQSLLA